MWENRNKKGSALMIIIGGSYEPNKESSIVKKLAKLMKTELTINGYLIATETLEEMKEFLENNIPIVEPFRKVKNDCIFGF